MALTRPSGPTADPAERQNNPKLYEVLDEYADAIEGGGPTTNYDLAKARSVPLVEERSQTVTLASGQNEIHSSALAKGKLFCGTRTLPWILIRFNNLDDLTDQTVLTAPNNPDHDRAETMVYVEENNRLYIAGNRTSRMAISEVDPEAMTETLVINEVLTFGQGVSPALASDGTHLYILTYNATSKIYKYRLSDYVQVASVSLTSRANGHALIYDGEYLYAGGSQWVAKVNPADLTFVDAALAQTGQVTDDGICSAGDYIFVGQEGGSGEQVHRIEKDSLTTAVASGVGDVDTYALHFDGEYVWHVGPGTPGTLRRIDPRTMAVQTITLASGEDHPSEILSDGTGRMFVACFISPSKVKRFYPLPGTDLASHAISAAVHTGTLTDAQIPSTIARDTELHTEDHDHDGTPTQKLLAANSHESPSADTHHATNHGAAEHTGIGGGLSVVATSDTSESLGIGFVDATGLSFAVAANKTYHFEWYVLFTSAATTTGLYLSLAGPASPTSIAYEVKYPFAQTTTSARNATAYETGTTATGSMTATTPLFGQMVGILVNGSNAGTLQVRFQTEIPTSAVVIKAGSGGRLFLMN